MTEAEQAKATVRHIQQFIKMAPTWMRDHPDSWVVIGGAEPVFIPRRDRTLNERDGVRNAIAAAHQAGVEPYVRYIPAASDLRDGDTL